MILFKNNGGSVVIDVEINLRKGFGKLPYTGFSVGGCKDN